MTNLKIDIGASCCFTGPRPRNFPWKSEAEQYVKPLCARLEQEIRQAVQNGYRHFISGMAIGVDLYAAGIVLNVRNDYPDLGITLEAAIPFPAQPNKWTTSQQEEYASILEQADKKTVIGKEPTVENFNKRNDYMINQAGLLIAVKPDKPGGTQRTIAYAKANNKKIVVIDPWDFMQSEDGV